MPNKRSPTTGKNRLLQFTTKTFFFVKKVLQLFTILLRYLWLFFPALFFLFGAYLLFWNLSQGKDLLISGLERTWRMCVLWVAVVFWGFTTWYSSRILVYKKDSLYNCGEDFFTEIIAGKKVVNVPVPGFTLNWVLYNFSQWVGFHLPRMLGYLCFAILLLAYWQLPTLDHPLTISWALVLLVLEVIVYGLLSKFLDEVGKAIFKRGRGWLTFSFWATLGLFLLILCWQYLTARRFDATDSDYHEQTVRAIILTGVLQLLFLYLVTNRHHLLKNRTKPSEQTRRFIEPRMPFGQKAVRYLLRFANVPYEERTFFLVFNLISMLAIAIYLTGVFNLPFAISLSSANFALLAFGILVGYCGLVSILSIHLRINFHVLILLLGIILGYTRESHYARLLPRPIGNTQQERPDLRTHFLAWAQHHKEAILAAKDSFHLFFVLADGGASRSGYWSASVLGRIHDSTGGKFDQHLFCLSGASGGSVGNATYFNLLYNNGLTGTHYETASQAFLKQDFLSYTLARMLGPDFFRTALPFPLTHLEDRAGALEASMETDTSKTSLARNFSVPFSALTPDTVNDLPVLCINTTRMQDGRPGVISNIRLEPRLFGKRLDVMGLLSADTDMRLSTAMVMGARFPYVSPAGRVDQVKKGKEGADDTTLVHYFVDGGYFDNSGAGVVQEMIEGLQEIIQQLNASPDSLQYNYLKRLRFYVLHISNSPVGDENLKKVHPIANDLMAPVTAIVGSYGTQTDVNDSRLEKYMQGQYRGDTTHYKIVNLYDGLDSKKVRFPMNWSISDYHQKKMKDQLTKSKKLGDLISWLNSHL